MLQQPRAVAGSGSGKIDAMEAVRGLGAMAVVLSHLSNAFYPGLAFGKYTSLAGRIASTTPFPVLFDGAFAVTLFFTLSGFVLSLSYLRTGSMRVLESAAVRRCIRLMVPVAASILMAWALLASHAMANQPVAALLGQSKDTWLANHYDFPPSLADALKQAVAATFHDVRYHASSTRNLGYNSSCWTMPIELLGSYVVFGLLALCGRLRNRSTIYVLLGAFFLRTWQVNLFSFVAGVALCDLYVNRISTGGGRVKDYIPEWVAVCLLCAAVLMVGAVTALASSHNGVLARIGGHARELGAIGVLVAVSNSQVLRRILSMRPLVFLGRVSFSLYLVHFPIEMSLGMHVYLLAVRAFGMGHAAGVAAAALATIATSLGVAWLGRQYVEAPAINWGRQLYDVVFRPSEDQVTEPAAS